MIIWMTVNIDKENRMMYTQDDDLHRSLFGKPPVVCNYFYHEEIRKSAKKGKWYAARMQNHSDR